MWHFSVNKSLPFQFELISLIIVNKQHFCKENSFRAWLKSSSVCLVAFRTRATSSWINFTASSRSYTKQSVVVMVGSVFVVSLISLRKNYVVRSDRWHKMMTCCTRQMKLHNTLKSEYFSETSEAHPVWMLAKLSKDDMIRLLLMLNLLCVIIRAHFLSIFQSCFRN